MKYIAILVLIGLFILDMNAQTPSMSAPTSTQGFVFKVDKTSGKIDMFESKEGKVITSDFTVNSLEVEIFDAKGEYAGTLELEAWNIPKEEVQSYEKLKIANLTFTNTKTGEELQINDVAVVEK